MDPPNPDTGGTGSQNRGRSNPPSNTSRSNSRNPSSPFVPPRFRDGSSTRSPSAGGTTGSNLPNVNRPRAQSTVNPPANPNTQASHTRSNSLVLPEASGDYGIDPRQDLLSSNTRSLNIGSPGPPPPPLSRRTNPFDTSNLSSAGSINLMGPPRTTSHTRSQSTLNNPTTTPTRGSHSRSISSTGPISTDVVRGRSGSESLNTLARSQVLSPVRTTGGTPATGNRPRAPSTLRTSTRAASPSLGSHGDPFNTNSSAVSPDVGGTPAISSRLRSQSNVNTSTTTPTRASHTRSSSFVNPLNTDDTRGRRTSTSFSTPAPQLSSPARRPAEDIPATVNRPRTQSNLRASTATTSARQGSQAPSVSSTTGSTSTTRGSSRTGAPTATASSQSLALANRPFGGTPEVTQYPGPCVGHPYRAIYDYIADTSTMPSAVSIEAGTEGRVLGQRDEQWLEVTVGRTGIRGWVPYQYVEVNQDVTVDELRVNNHRTYTTSVSINISRLDMSPSTSLQRVIITLIAALKEKEPDFPFVNPLVRDVLKDDTRRRNLTRDLISGLDPVYDAVASNPAGTLQQLRDGIQPVDRFDTRKGYYLRVTSKFKSDPSRKPEVYTGNTNAGMNNRWSGHQSDFNSTEPKGNACSASAQQSSKMEMLPIGIMEGAATLEMLLGEQVLLLANGTYKSKLFDAGFEVEVAEAKAASRDVVREVVKSISWKEMAVSLTSLADTIMKKDDINFTPLRLRKGFGAGEGLNHSSPVAELSDRYEKTLWIKVEEPGVKQTFYREGIALGPMSATEVSYETNFMHMRRYTGEEGGISIRFNKSRPHPPEGTMIYPTWEISLNGPHHTPWARLNSIGLPLDWELANSLALRVDWEQDGVWKSTYQQIEHPAAFAPTNEQTGLNSYAKAMCVVRYLQQRAQANPRGWFFDAGIARVKSLTFDNFTQTVHIKESTPPGEAFGRPEFKTEAQLKSELEAAGCVNVGGVWQNYGWRDGIVKKKTVTGPPTKLCDACYIRLNYEGDQKLDRNSRDKVKCVRHVEDDEETDTCEACYFRGLLCSWTHTSDLTSEMMKALNFMPEALREIKTISPTILYIGQEETGLDENDEAQVDEE